MHLLLPVLEARLTSAHVAWLRQASAQHPVAVLATIVLVAALLALPVLGVFRWVSAPWRGR